MYFGVVATKQLHAYLQQFRLHIVSIFITFEIVLLSMSKLIPLHSSLQLLHVTRVHFIVLSQLVAFLYAQNICCIHSGSFILCWSCC